MYVNNTNGNSLLIFHTSIIQRSRHNITLYAHCLPCFIDFICHITFLTKYRDLNLLLLFHATLRQVWWKLWLLVATWQKDENLALCNSVYGCSVPYFILQTCCSFRCSLLLFCLTLEKKKDTLSRNVGKGLPTYAAKHKQHSVDLMDLMSCDANPIQGTSYSVFALLLSFSLRFQPNL